MNKPLWLFMFCMAPAFLLAQPQSFGFRKKLDGAGENGWYRIHLSQDIVSTLQPGLNDLRIYRINNNDTLEMPFLLEQGIPIKQEENKLTLLNQSYERKCCSWTSFELDNTKPVNRLELAVSNQSFDKYLDLEGSDDGEQWKTIRENIRISRIKTAHSYFTHTTIDFPPGKYKMLRVSFDDDGSDRIYVSGAKARYLHPVQKRYEKVTLADVKLLGEMSKGVTSYLIRFPQPARVSQIRVVPAEDEQYFRSVNIYLPAARRQGSPAWTISTTGTIHSLDTSIIFISPVHTDSLRIDIINNDNLPANLRSIEVYREKLSIVTNLSGMGEVYLYYGSPKAKAPKYDLEWFIHKIPSELPVLVSGPAENLKHSAEKEGSGNLWLWVVLIGVAVLITFFSYKMLQGARPQ